MILLAFMGEAFAAGFGVAAALLVVGGYVLLRWQRNRQQYELMRAALEQGLPGLPAEPPFWLASQRQGALILTLGLALVAVGAAGWALARGVAPPDPASLQPTISVLAGEPEAATRPRPVPEPGKEGRERPRPGGEAARLLKVIRPAPNPAKDLWERAQTQRSVSLVLMACGAVLAPLGVVRLAFARVERRHAPASPQSPGSPPAPPAPPGA